MSGARPPRPDPPEDTLGDADLLIDETAPPRQSPLAAALPFRAPKPGRSERTVAFPMMTPADLARLTAGAPAPSAPATWPPGVAPVPAAGGPVPASSTGHFGLSIEQYAALCAEIAVFPDRGEAIFARYGLAQRNDRATADLSWRERLRSDNGLMTRWQSLYLHYHEYYSRMKQR